MTEAQGSHDAAGCEDREVATCRAAELVTAVPVSAGWGWGFWPAKAEQYLAAYLHAAALAGGDMRLVAHWAGGRQDPEHILMAAGAQQWSLRLSEFRGGRAPMTVASLRAVMSAAISVPA